MGGYCIGEPSEWNPAKQVVSDVGVTLIYKLIDNLLTDFRSAKIYQRVQRTDYSA